MVIETAADRAEQVQHPLIRDQIQMSAAGKMTTVRFDAPFGLNAEYGIQRLENSHQPIQIGGLTRVHDVDIEAVAGTPRKTAESTPPA